MKRFTIIALFCAIAIFAEDPMQVFQNPKASPEVRAAALVSKMSLEEKVSQMQNTAAAIPRLGIPAYDWWNEGLHGVARAGLATVFPQAIGIAATFDTALMGRIAETISTEARGKYNDAIAHDNHGRYFGLTFWSPNINIFRDPRWGRGQETYGEDPFLTSRLAVEFIRGIQGNDPHYFKAIATAKHYAVHSGPETSRHSFDVHPSDEDMADTYLPQFQASIVEAKAYSVMCAYNAVNGAPACGSTMLLDDILRKKWGFDGYVVSDCGAVGDFVQGHRYSANMAAASAAAVKAGTELDCGSEYKSLVDAVHHGLISEAEIDRALVKLFVARIRLGMFDPPAMVPFSKLSMKDVANAEHQDLALNAARESMVLLRNENQTLPLAAKAKKIAVIGPTAFDPDALLGNYNGIPPHIVTPLEGIEREWGVAAVTYALGATYTTESMALIPPSAFETVGAQPVRGLTVEYFDNDSLKGEPKLKRVEKQGYLRWDMHDPAVVAAVGRERFSTRWSGTLHVSEGGKYQLGLKRLDCHDCRGKDAVQLWLDGNVLVKDDSRGGAEPTTKSAAVTLEAGKQYSIKLEYRQSGGGAGIELMWRPEQELLLKEAETAVRGAEVVVLCLGLNSNLEGEESPIKIPGFAGGDRTTLDLPEAQRRLQERISALKLKQPMVVVLLNGSSVNLPLAQTQAVLEAWYPGEQGGTAIAETLSGKNNPAGRLPVTFYQSVDQLPQFDQYAMQGRTYRYFTGKPLFPFGHGLSYSTFRYSGLDWKWANDGGLRVSAKVTNASKREGDEVVETYLSYPNAKGIPLTELRHFERIHLRAGESRIIRFGLDKNSVRQGVPAKLSVGGGQPLEDWTRGRYVEKALVGKGAN